MRDSFGKEQKSMSEVKLFPNETPGIRIYRTLKKYLFDSCTFSFNSDNVD